MSIYLIDIWHMILGMEKDEFSRLMEEYRNLVHLGTWCWIWRISQNNPVFCKRKLSKFNTQFTLRLRSKGTSHLMEWQSPGIEAVEGLKRYFDNIINNKNNLWKHTYLYVKHLPEVLRGSGIEIFQRELFLTKFLFVLSHLLQFSTNSTSW